MKKSWLMICNYGAYQFIVITCMGSLAAWFTYLCITNAEVVAAGARGELFLELGGLKGTGASTLFIGQAAKWLSVAATGSCSVPTLILWGCMTGGTPALHPASINFAFGRRAYQSANRVIMAIQLIPSALGTAIMIAVIDAGKGMLGYWILLAVVLFGIATTIPMFMMKNADAKDCG